MNYLDDFIYRVKTGRLFAGLEKPVEKKEPTVEEKPGETVTFRQANLPEILPVEEKKPIGPDQIIHFLFMGKTYIAESFNLNFRQDVDARKNRPDSFTYGGTIQITLSETPDHTINEWMAQTYMMRNGEIRIFQNLPKITQSALLTVFFEDAYCVKYSKKIDAVTFGLQTALTISPRKIKIGNEELENKWKKKEPLSHTITTV